MSLSEDKAAKALKEHTDAEAAKGKVTIATANGSSAGSFSLTSLHAQAIDIYYNVFHKLVCE
jgi:hypothetical protein